MFRNLILCGLLCVFTLGAWKAGANPVVFLGMGALTFAALYITLTQRKMIRA
jgi:hypothetical protein